MFEKRLKIRIRRVIEEIEVDAEDFEEGGVKETEEEMSDGTKLPKKIIKSLPKISEGQ